MGDSLDRLGEVLLAHDYLNQRGGAERVVLAMSGMWPAATIYTSLYRRESTFEGFAEREVRTSPLDRLPFDRHFRLLFPLYPAAFRTFGELDADLVISSSSGWAHAVRTSPRAFHVVYCHTPARWLWGDYVQRSVTRGLMAPALSLLRGWDRNAARRPDMYIANSQAIRGRIRSIYGRDAPVVYPPVDTERFTPRPRGQRLLVVTRLLSHKRVDLIIAAAESLGLGLDVVGVGPAATELRAGAGPNVTFHGRLGDAAVTELFEHCRAYCLPGWEDFGIASVEAQAAGKPVIAFAAGGALETVDAGVTGVLFERQAVPDLIEAIRRCDLLEAGPELIASWAGRFSTSSFEQALGREISRARAAISA